MPIREDLLGNAFASVFSKAFQRRVPLSSAASERYNAAIQTAVYPLAILDAFLTSEHATAVASELQSPHLPFSPRTSDLFDFHQTAGLESSINPSLFPALTALVAELYAPPFVALLERILHSTDENRAGNGNENGDGSAEESEGALARLTSIPKSRLSCTKKTITAQRYRRGDFLLPHDDRLLSRRIAFILYFPIGNESESCPGLEGGRLMAMRSDEQGRPVAEGADFLVPRFNRAVFFEVTRASFHQVEQIYSEAVPRYSVICWFHDLEEESHASPKNALSKTLSANPRQVPIPILIPIPIPMRLPSLLPDSLLLGMLEEFKEFGEQVHRPAVKGTFLASSSYTTTTTTTTATAADREPIWMRLLLQRSTSDWLQERTGLQLDWPTRPVAWLLQPAKHCYYKGSLMVDYQADVDYNYKTRQSATPNPHTQLHVTIRATVQPGGRIRAFTHLSRAPPRVKKHSSSSRPSPNELIVLITMKFAITSKDHTG
jgi:hypothetical protein